MAQPLFGRDMSKSSIAQRRKLANALIAEATKYEVSPHWATAIAKGLQGLVGGYQNAQADASEAERSAAISEAAKRMSPEELMQASFQYDEPGLMEMGQFQQRQKLAQAEAEARAAAQGQDQRNWQATYDQRERLAQADDARMAAAQAARGPERVSVKQADGSELLIERDPATGAWKPAQVPEGGAVVGPQHMNKPPTEAQSKDLGWYNRATGVAPQLDAVDGALTDLTGNVAGNFGVYGNYMKSPAYRQAEGLGKEWLATILRKDSGANITAQEFELYGPTYLPQPGDKEADILRKREARARANEGLRIGLAAQNILRDEIDRNNAVPQPGEGDGGPVQDPNAGWEDTQVPGVRIRRKAM